MPTIPDNKASLVRQLYFKEKMSMRVIADKLNVSLDAVVYFMRKHKIPKRSFTETNAIVFENKKLSFKEKTKLTLSESELKLSGLMLYWAEGYKSPLSKGVDFVNSDKEMIYIFLKFLRKIYKIDESRLRILLYCYSDQNSLKLIDFWSQLTQIPKSQFTKPYIRKDFRKDGRKMEHGMIHLRYGDKKLFLCIMRGIDFVKLKMRRW